MKWLSLTRTPTQGVLPSPISVTLTVAAFVVAAAPHLLSMPGWLALISLLPCIWRVAAAWLNGPPPHWMLRTVITFAALAAVVVAYGGLWGRRAATALLCVMIAVKLTEMFRTRDARQIAALGFFLVAAQFLFGQQINLLPYLFIACALATSALLSIQRDDDRRRHPAVDIGQPERSSEPRAYLITQLKHGWLLLALSIPFALVLFTLFPRLASPLWGIPDNALDGRTGLSDEMSPGSISSLFIDDRPAFRVEFDSDPPTQSELYWRGPVLWRLDGTRWRALSSTPTSAVRTPDRGENRWEYTVQLEPSERRWLFSLDYPINWTEDALLSLDYQLIRKRPVTRLISYEVISQPQFVDAPTLEPNLRAIALTLPDGQNPRTRALADEYRIRYPNDRELINAVLRWFNEDEFFYSLETLPLGWNGADEFLFDLRTGYCEYYASSFAILMRAAGIPTRIVTGYQGGYWQSASDYLLVRQSDAHAWTEVWLDDTGWTRVDPTAAVSPTRILENARAALNQPLGWLDGAWVQRMRNQYDRV
ncbi:MAG: DUF3488 and transglutaminase-like domain-containing protein, partial [Pseudomonadota bacterium]